MLHLFKPRFFLLAILGWWGLACIASWFFLLAVVTVAYAADPTLRIAVVALPEIERLGITDLLDVELSQKPGIVIVDRSNIKKVRDELDFSALCQAEAIEERQVLGKTLGADWLVVLRVVEPETLDTDDSPGKKQIHAVVVDCRYGVRLAEALVLLTPEKSSKVILEWLTEVYKKHAGGIQQIVGIMPLVPKSAYGRIESLHTGLGQLIGKVLLRDAGVAVLNAEECLSIERERKLGTIPRTSVPLTIIKGNYLVEFHPDSKPTVLLNFRATRNGRECGEETVELQRVDLDSLQISATSLNQILQFLQKTLRTSAEIRCTPEELDTIVEALIRQAEQQATIGAVDQVCRIAEAILLIKPDQVAARLYAIGSCRRWGHVTAPFPSRSHGRPGSRSKSASSSKKISGPKLWTPTQAMHRQMDHIEYLIRNHQITIAQASQLYVTLNLIRQCPALAERFPTLGVFSMRPRKKPKDSDPIRKADRELMEHYFRSVLPMMRERVKGLPLKSDPSLHLAFDYGIGPLGRSELSEEARFKSARKVGKRCDPDSRESQLFCWSTCSAILAAPIHGMARLCYQDDPERYRALDQVLLDFEEERIREVRLKGFSHHLATRHIQHVDAPALRRIWMRYPEVLQQYKAWFDRLEQEDDPIVRLYGMAGNYALLHHVQLKETAVPQLVPDGDMKRLRQAFEQIQKVHALCKEIERDEPPVDVRFDWSVGILRFDPSNLDHWCNTESKFLGRIVRQTPVLETVPEDIDSEALKRAQSIFRTMANTYNSTMAKFPSIERADRRIVRLQTHLAEGRKCAWYSRIPNLDPRDWVSFLKLDEKTDLVVTDQTLELMKGPGKLKTIFTLPSGKINLHSHQPEASRGSPDFIYDVLYDGEYLWPAAAQSGIYVLTREGKLLGNIHDAQGLPFSSAEEKLVEKRPPLTHFLSQAPGKLLVAMKTRESSIVGRIEVDVSKRPTFKILHSANRTPIERDTKSFLPPDVAYYFGPWIHLFKYNDQQQWLAIPRRIGRDSQETYSTLWINIEDPGDVRTDTQPRRQRSRFSGFRPLNGFNRSFPALSDNRAVGIQIRINQNGTRWVLVTLTPPELASIGTSDVRIEALKAPDGQAIPCYEPASVAHDTASISVISTGGSFFQIDKKTLNVDSYPLLGAVLDYNNPQVHFSSAHYGIIAFNRDIVEQVKLDTQGPTLSSYFNRVPPKYLARHARALKRAVEAGAEVVPSKNPFYRDSQSPPRYVKRLQGGCRLAINDKTKNVQELCRLLPEVYAIQMLTIDRAKLTEDDFRYLSRCSIDTLALNLPPDKNGVSPLNDKTMALLLKNKALRCLYIHGNGMTDNAFVTVGDAQCPEQIRLISNRFGDKTLSHLAKAKRLESLTIQGPHYTDQGLLSLLESNRLPNLFPIHTKITLEGLARLYSKRK